MKALRLTLHIVVAAVAASLSKSPEPGGASS
jgi:hypothetical protein